MSEITVEKKEDKKGKTAALAYIISIIIFVPLFFAILTGVGVLTGIASIKPHIAPSECLGGPTKVLLAIVSGDPLGAAKEAVGTAVDSVKEVLGIEGKPVECLGDGEWVYPLERKLPITSLYGYRLPFLCANPAAGCLHNGLDLAGTTGTRVLAAREGEVVLAREYGTCGNSVIIEHPGKVWTLYCHLDWEDQANRIADITVEVGDFVTAGQDIGGLGNTGRSTGPHLHLSVFVDRLSWQDGYVVDPIPFFYLQGIDLTEGGIIRTPSNSFLIPKYCNPNLYQVSWCGE
jgi:murein DD-endopeptidase MepM/ murein hydrolase activator NlpD